MISGQYNICCVPEQEAFQVTLSYYNCSPLKWCSKTIHGTIDGPPRTVYGAVNSPPAAVLELPGYLGRQYARQSHYVTAEFLHEAWAKEKLASFF